MMPHTVLGKGAWPIPSSWGADLASLPEKFLKNPEVEDTKHMSQAWTLSALQARPKIVERSES
jgi:hypothetical protein